MTSTDTLTLAVAELSLRLGRVSDEAHDLDERMDQDRACVAVDEVWAAYGDVDPDGPFLRALCHVVAVENAVGLVAHEYEQQADFAPLWMKRAWARQSGDEQQMRAVGL